MAFSQVQCLDNSHVNWRSSESKPEFFYSEEQRLALEALVAQGPEAFYEVLKRENIRDFLSELELQRILETIEVYDPGSQDPRDASCPQGPEDNGVGNGEEASGAGGALTEAEPPPSLEYWPQKSDRSIPQLDLGWPDTIAYRGVTRASVYMQPPIDGQAHIKEVVRKMISQAQKVSQRWWVSLERRLACPGIAPPQCMCTWTPTRRVHCSPLWVSWLPSCLREGPHSLQRDRVPGSSGR